MDERIGHKKIYQRLCQTRISPLDPIAETRREWRAADARTSGSLTLEDKNWVNPIMYQATGSSRHREKRKREGMRDEKKRKSFRNDDHLHLSSFLRRSSSLAKHCCPRWLSNRGTFSFLLPVIYSILLIRLGLCSVESRARTNLVHIRRYISSVFIFSWRKSLVNVRTFRGHEQSPLRSFENLTESQKNQNESSIFVRITKANEFTAKTLEGGNCNHCLSTIKAVTRDPKQ